jgi:DNA-binding CsgD family transcriptional regulator
MMRTAKDGHHLLGRRHECDQLDRLIATVHQGASAVLVVRGDAGAGKSALLDYVACRATGSLVLRCGGVESEMELAFAALHQLCAPLLPGLHHLPSPQRDALATALGLRSGDPPDRFLVSLAVLSLFDAAAQDTPLICLIDDAQWLDRASMHALAFVGRRLLAESVGLVFASRQPGVDGDLAGLPELILGGLGYEDACALLDSVIAGPIDERVRDRIVAETAGNPLALLELPRGRNPAELGGGFGFRDRRPLTARIEQSFVRRAAETDPATQRLLLIAAAEPTGDPLLLFAAAEGCGLDVREALLGAEDLVSVDRRVCFRHPLVRSAVYGAASALDRRTVHDALARCISPEIDPDRRVWHRAHATTGADEAVAAELETSAARAAARGGLAATAAFLARAVTLTPDPQRRAQRALAAARAAHSAGANADAVELLAVARRGALDELDAAEGLLLEGQIVFSTLRGREASALLQEAAHRLEGLDVKRSREAYLQATWAACIAMHLTEQRDVSLAVRDAPIALAAPTPEDLMLDGLATRFLEGYSAGAPLLRAAMDAFRSSQVDGVFDMGWVWLTAEIGDADALCDLGSRQVEAAREAGALTRLPSALHALAFWHAYAGDLETVESMLAESDSITTATGDAPMNNARLLLLALRGDDSAEAHIAACIRDGTDRGEGALVRHAEGAAALYYIGLCRYEDALAWARREVSNNKYAFHMSAMPELVEAAVRCNDIETAQWAAEQLHERALASKTAWTSGVAARCRALVSDGDEADARFGEAIALLAETGLTVELARTELLYGEWLRREHRRRDAREQLRRAHERFAAIGAVPFAARAARELHATGETVRRRNVETRDEMTAQELQIASLAAAGSTNPQIGAQLFISPRTVEWHLRKIFTKLEITSRRQLQTALGPVAAKEILRAL